jgi:hypothetical protein
MLFKFGRKRFSDVVKVVAFLDKEGIEYEVMTDIEVGLGKQEPQGQLTGPIVPEADEEYIPRKPGETWLNGVDPLPARDPDPLWKPAQHDNKVCSDKAGCKAIQHYGAQAL